MSINFASDKELTRYQVDAIEKWSEKWGDDDGYIHWNGSRVPAINVVMHKGQNVKW